MIDVKESNEIIKRFIDDIRKHTKLTTEMSFTFDMVNDNGDVMKDNNIYIRLNKPLIKFDKELKENLK